MEAPKTIQHEIGGVQNDALRFGLHGVKSDLVGSHPLQSAYESAKKTQEETKRKVLANTYGTAMPLKMDLDRQILSRTELCQFSGAKIYPGNGIRFIRSDSQRYFRNRLKPSKLTWTAMYRKQHKKDIAQEAFKKRRRATKKPYSRSIVGATLEIHETYPNEKMGCGMAEFELRHRLESLIINEEEFIKSSVPEIVEIYDDPTKRGINNVKVTATDALTREGVQSKFRDLENKLYDKGNHKVECKDFPGLEQALKNSAFWEIPEYLKSIAILVEKDRGKTTDFFHFNIQILVCAAIKEMKDFSVGDLDWDTLKKWGATLNCAEKFGFQVGFAENLLKKNLLAYFAAQNIPKSTAEK